MSLLQEIQQDALNPNVDVATLLRKCKILAARLDNQPIKDWVEHELNGYPTTDHLPDYRVLNVHSLGHFIGDFGKQLSNAPIPPSCIPEESRHLVEKAYLTDGIGGLVSLVSNKKSGSLSSAWPADALRAYGQQIYEDMNCISAWRVIGQSQIAGVLDTIRNRVLSFVLEIEAENPYAGDTLAKDQPIDKERVTEIYQTVILGDVANLTTGSNNISHVTNTNIKKDDFESLKEYLRNVGISNADISDLEKSIKKEIPIKKGRYGNNVSTWIGKMTSKAASGLWKIGTDVAAKVIAEALNKYYGM